MSTRPNSLQLDLMSVAESTKRVFLIPDRVFPDPEKATKRPSGQKLSARRHRIHSPNMCQSTSPGVNSLPSFASVSERNMSDYIKRLFTLAVELRNDNLIHAADLEMLLEQSGLNFPSSVITRILQEVVDESSTVPWKEHLHVVHIIRKEVHLKGHGPVPTKDLVRAAVFWATSNRERRIRKALRADSHLP